MNWPFEMPLANRAQRSTACRLLKDELAPLMPQARFEVLDRLTRDLNVDPVSRYRSLTWGQVREMAGAGIRFGSHTVFHSILTAVTPAVAERDLTESKGRIEEEIYPSCTDFAYPNGTYNNNVIAMVRSAGYQTALTQDPGPNQESADDLQLRRIHVPPDDSKPVFASRLALGDRLPHVRAGRKGL
jgi:hypothetical protein